jgi:hypothetical protein
LHPQRGGKPGIGSGNGKTGAETGVTGTAASEAGKEQSRENPKA